MPADLVVVFIGNYLTDINRLPGFPKVFSSPSPLPRFNERRPRAFETFARNFLRRVYAGFAAAAGDFAASFVSAGANNRSSRPGFMAACSPLFPSPPPR
jgi:hypothetical protein